MARSSTRGRRPRRRAQALEGLQRLGELLARVAAATVAAQALAVGQLRARLLERLAVLLVMGQRGLEVALGVLVGQDPAAAGQRAEGPVAAARRVGELLQRLERLVGPAQPRERLDAVGAELDDAALRVQPSAIRCARS